jgi:hypothetical protein
MAAGCNLSKNGSPIAALVIRNGINLRKTLIYGMISTMSAKPRVAESNSSRPETVSLRNGYGFSYVLV